MEAIAAVDALLEQQALVRREKAFGVIANSRVPSMITMQVPIWFAFLMLALILSLPASKANPLPYVAGVLGFSILWTTAMVVRLNRRIDAIVQLIT